MPRIQFTCDHTTKATPPESFKEGEIVDRDDASAWHFISRGLAVEAGAVQAKKKTTARKKVDDEDTGDAEE